MTRISYDRPKLLTWYSDVLNYHRNFTAPLHFVVFTEGNKYEKDRVDKSFELIWQSLFYISTTKTIVIINKPKSQSEEYIKSIFKLAAANRNNYISIVSCYKENLLIYRQNLFSKIITVKTVDESLNEKFFPDVFEGDLSGYEIGVGVRASLWPDYYKNYTINYSKSDENLYLNVHLFKAYECFEKKLNISSKYISVPTSLMDINAAKGRHVITNELQIFLGQFQYYLSLNLDDIYTIKSSKIVFMVPVLREEKIGLSINILYSFLTLSGVIIVFIVCARYFKFPIDEWSPFNLYSLMLGIGVNMEPRYSIRSIIMFLALFTVSFFFVSDLVSDLTTLNYKTEETEMVKSIQDILKKDFEVILKEENLERKRQRYVLLYMVELGDYKRISNMITPPGHAETNTLKKIFILPENDAEKLLEVNKNMINGIKYKISEELLMYQSYYVIPFEFNSILRIKFHEIYTRILEAGLDVKWRSDYEYANKIDKRLTPDESDDDDNTFILVLILVVVIGNYNFYDCAAN